MKNQLDTRKLQILVTKNETQVTNSIQNFQVVDAEGWDLGDPIGYGATLDDAIMDFAENWEMKRDQEIEIEKILYPSDL